MLTTPYHKDRIRAVNFILQKIRTELSLNEYTLLDFGIGSGTQIELLNLFPNKIIGIDASDHMIEISRRNLSNFDNVLLYKGGVDQLINIEDKSVYITLCINTFEYLDIDSQTIFFKEVHRITKGGGYLIIMTGNELFDLFALNSGTVDFFRNYFGQTNVATRLTDKKPPYKNADRRNPLNFKYELLDHGFIEIKQAYSQWHKTQPNIAIVDSGGRYRNINPNNNVEDLRDHDFDPNTMIAKDIWKAMFQCTIFSSLSYKQ